MDPRDPAPAAESSSGAAPATAPTEPAAWSWIVLAFGLACCVGASGLVRWVGVAAVLAASPVAWRAIQGVPELRRGFMRARAHLPFFVTASLFVVLLSPVLGGEPPASRDHGIHYYQVRLLLDELLPRGRTSGWVEAFNNGYPFGESYPVLGYLWTGALHWLSLGLVDLRTSYALGIAAMWALSVWAIARLGAAMAREVFDDARSAVAWTAAVGGMLWLLDPGASREGGWTYTMFHGVWPQLLSTSLWVLSLTLQWDAFQRPSPRRIALAVLALGGSILAHPFGLLTAAASAGLWIAVLTLTDTGRRLPAGRLRWWAMMHVGAGAVALGWVVTFLHASDSMARGPVIWRPLGELAAGLLRGDLFHGPWALTGPATVVGLIVLARRGAARCWLVVGLLAAMLVLASPAAITVLRLDLVLSSFKNLQFPRWSIAIKPLVFAIAAVGVVFLARAARGRLPMRPAAAGLGPRFMAALVVAPLLATLVPELQRLVPRPIGGIDTLATAELGAADAALTEALADERTHIDGPLRVAFLRTRMSGATWPLLALTDAQADIVLDGHVPSINFKHRVGKPRPAVLAALGVTHVLWDGPIAQHETLVEHLEEIGSFGRFRLARFVTDMPPTPVAELDGAGTLELVQASTHEVVVDLVGTDADTVLYFRTPPHVKWQVDRDGTPLETEAWGSGIVQTRVTSPGDGRVRLRYVHAPIEEPARWVSLLAVLASLAALALPRPLSAAVRLHARSAARVSWVLGVATLAVLLAFVARRQERLMRETWAASVDEGEIGKSPPVFVRDLVDAGDIRIERTPERACIALHEKNALAGCSEADHAPAVAFLYREPFLYRCLELSIPPLGETRVYFDGVRPHQEVIGTLLRVGHDGRGRDIQFSFSARPRPLGNHPRYLRLDGERVASGHPLVLTSDRRAPDRVCIAAAVFDPP